MEHEVVVTRGIRAYFAECKACEFATADYSHRLVAGRAKDHELAMAPKRIVSSQLDAVCEWCGEPANAEQKEVRTFFDAFDGSRTRMHADCATEYEQAQMDAYAADDKFGGTTFGY